MVGLAHRPDSFGAANGGGNLPVGPGLAVGNGLQSGPHRALKVCSHRGQGQVEPLPFPGQVGQKRLPRPDQQRGLRSHALSIRQGIGKIEVGECLFPLQNHRAKHSLDPKPRHQLYLRTTATTLPRSWAPSPSMGWYSGFSGMSQIWPFFRRRVFTVASSSKSATTMSPL